MKNWLWYFIVSFIHCILYDTLSVTLETKRRTVAFCGTEGSTSQPVSCALGRCTESDKKWHGSKFVLLSQEFSSE